MVFLLDGFPCGFPFKPSNKGTSKKETEGLVLSALFVCDFEVGYLEQAVRLLC